MQRWTAGWIGGALLCANAWAGGAAPDEAAYARQFQGYDACFMLYSLNQQQMVREYNPGQRCSQRLAANSTFKIPLSLMAFDQGIINQATVFKWDGSAYDRPELNRNQTPRSWMRDSVVWVSQQLAPQLGRQRLQRYLADFHYGNQDLSGDPGQNNGLTHAWLSSSLRISAQEQLAFLRAMWTGQLPVSRQALAATRWNLYQGKLIGGADYYGKTGAGRHPRSADDASPGPLRDGWFVGVVEQGPQRYVFVSNLTDQQAPPPGDRAFGSGILRPITVRLLNDYFGSH